MASQISISTVLSKPSRLVKIGTDLLERDALEPAETSELAAAVATLELIHGGLRKARRLFNQSLRSPNDNSLAQAEWASRFLNTSPDVPETWLVDPATAEAAYYKAIYSGAFEEGLRLAVTWQVDEPFASRPFIAASFLSCMLGDVMASEAHARRGLQAEPQNSVLLNNLAFALLRQSKEGEALEMLRRVVQLEGREIAAQTLANFGLLAYRSGDFSLGERLYDAAIQGFDKLHAIDASATAAAFHAYAARITGAVKASELEARAADIMKKTNSVIARRVAELISSDVKPLPDIQGLRKRRTQGWIYDKEKNLIVIGFVEPFSK
jgi:tetratricopeptide (TPR) repeat protein